MLFNEQTHTVFEYLYRDASNYKAYGTLLLRGRFSEEQQAALALSCEGAEYFIAEQVDIPSLCEQLWGHGSGRNEDDHVWHEFIGLREPSAEEQATLEERGALDDLLRRFRAVQQWDLSLSPNAWK